MMTTDLARTPLHEWHVTHGGRMVDFAGWSMPVQYKSIADEHNATRNAVGVFDISHMGRLFVSGTAALNFLDSVLTRRISDMQDGQIRYALVCNDEGGILDDVLVYRDISHERPSGMHSYLVVVNASNREKIVDWFRQHSKAVGNSPLEFKLDDHTTDTGMIAVQGPKAIEIVSSLIELSPPSPSEDLRGMRYYSNALAFVGKEPVTVSRTGYTGEDGCEIICDKSFALTLWERLIDAAAKVGGMAAGLGARDTLRLEAAMPLYGHELSEAINPLQAGLDFAVNLGGREFIGSKALEKFAADKSQPVRIGIELDCKRVPREGCPVLHNDAIVGEVTSGTFSPTLNRPIAMAYVQPTAQTIGTKLSVDIRGTQYPAVVVPLPFYNRSKKN